MVSLAGKALCATFLVLVCSFAAEPAEGGPLPSAAWDFEVSSTDRAAHSTGIGGWAPTEVAAAANWLDLRNPALQNDLRAIDRAPASLFLCAVGSGEYGAPNAPPGHGPLVCRSWDGGQNWTISQPAVDLGPLPNSFVHLIAVDFVSPLMGWAAGCIGYSEAAVIYRTIDGGESWELQYETAARPPGNLAVLDICFVDSLRGWAVGAIDPGSNVAIVATIDGGQTWETQGTGINALVSQVDFLDEDVGFALANLKYTLGTVDGGANWNIVGQNSSSNQAWGLDFLDAQRGFYVSGTSGPGIKATEDGGQTWTTVYDGPGREYDVRFLDMLRGWVVGDNGATARTTDGGHTWQPAAPAFQQELLGCAPIDDGSVCVAGNVGMLARTQDAGDSWQQVDGEGYVTAVFLRDLDFVSEQTGWIVGAFGQALRTDDGGANWTRLHLGTSVSLGGVSFSSPTDGWICGGSSAWRTTNAGDSWELTLETSTSLIDIYALDAQTVWVSGTYGSVYRTRDGGGSWDTLSTGTTEALPGVWFLDANTGWVIGYSGSILHTTDGGDSWSLQDSGTASPLFSVCFADNLTGWAVSLDDQVIHTADGGANWSVQYAAPASIKGIHFTDSQHGCVAGGVVGMDFIACTNDGGDNWTVSNVPSPQNNLMEVVLASRQVGYAVGFNGKVLKATDLPVSPVSVVDAEGSHRIGINWIRPNPSRGQFVVSLSLASPEPATVAMYDAAGRRIGPTYLVPHQQETQEVEFDAQGFLAPGIYFVRLQQGHVVVSEKVCVVQ